MINPWREVYDLPQSVDPWKNGVPDFALYLDVEPTNFCNFKCEFCVGQQQGKRKRGHMSLDMFAEICRQAEKYGCRGIRFLRWGEPLLNKDFFEMIRMAKNHGLLTHVTTNGILLKDAEQFIETGIDSVIISLQGLNAEEYKRLRKGNYDVLVSRIVNLKCTRDELGANNPFISLSTTVTDETQEEVDAFKKKWEGIVDYVGVGYTWFKRLEDKSGVQDYLSRAKKLPHLFKCQEVMVKLSIDWDGTVSPCCLDYDQQLAVGNIQNDDLMELWNSEDVKAIRTLLSHKRQDMFTLCQTCELNYNFRGKDE